MIDNATESPQDDVPLPSPGTFRNLNLPEVLLRATEELGFETCTEIQALTLPVIERGQDVAAQAQTGTGKTAAFILGGFARLLATESNPGNANQPRMLVIAPTRELAIQIKKDADTLGAHSGLTSVVVYGGIDYDKQRRDLAKGADILIGTPGRLIDYFKQKIFDLKKLEIVVLDEADRMFDLGFIADIRYLLRRMPDPERRLSMLFSATLSHRVMELAYEHMDNPEAVKTKSTGVTAKGVRQILYQPGTDEKVPLLLGLLDKLKPPRSIIFVNTKRAAETIESYLLGNDISCGTLSGDVRQSKRQRILADFTAGDLPVLIATDVAARGLHIDDVSHVFNYDLPQQAEDYVHRIGRTARAGSDGIAVSFACENYSFSLPDIQAYIGQSIPLEMITDDLLATPKPAKRIVRERVTPRPGKKHKAHAGTAGKSPDKRTPRRTRDRRSSAKSSPDTQQSEQNLTQPSTGSNTAKPGDAQKSDKTGSKPRRRRRRRKQTSDSSSAATTDSTAAVQASKVSTKD